MTGDTKACFQIENKPGEAYFFNGTQYIRIGGITPGTTDDHIITGPKTIMDYWPSLKKCEFKCVDAMFPLPGCEGYFFSGEQYALIAKIIPGTTDDCVKTGPKNTCDYWPSLKKCGFKTVDTIMPINATEAYFFCGEKYAHIGNIHPGTTDDSVMNGPKNICDYWPSLKKCGFNTIDAVLPISKEEAYFFKGKQYVRIGKIVPGGSDDYIITGPKDVAGYWPSLKKAGFY
ncbi:hypothetical protein Q9L58_009167 [Maublancomyces gigas]|uniref:Uncharacterized protein n=1 Tax=Discina gigas TaxID=1032678 RepID=A0ABR3G7M8_9PEZI